MLVIFATISIVSFWLMEWHCVRGCAITTSTTLQLVCSMMLPEVKLGECNPVRNILLWQQTATLLGLQEGEKMQAMWVPERFRILRLPPVFQVMQKSDEAFILQVLILAKPCNTIKHDTSSSTKMEYFQRSDFKRFFRKVPKHSNHLFRVPPRQQACAKQQH